MLFTKNKLPLLLPVLVMLFACNASTVAIKKSFYKEVFIDKSFAKYELPFKTILDNFDELRYALRDSNYLIFVGDVSLGGGAYREFAVADAGKKYLVRSYHVHSNQDPKYDIDSVGLFNFYRLKSLHFLNFKMLDEQKDSAEVNIITRYEVVPMFSVGENPRTIKFIATKKGGKWQIKNIENLLYQIYINKGNLPGQGGFYGLMPADKYSEWFEKNLEEQKNKRKHL